MRYLTFIAVFAFTISTAFAQGIPVYDAASMAQLITQLEQMAKDYQKQLEQLDQAIEQTNALTGRRNMGALANSALEAELRRYLPNTWEDTMHMMSAIDLSETALNTKNLYKNFYNNYQPITGADTMTLDPTGPIAQALDRRTATTYAAMAASEQTYNVTSERLSTYETLLNELDKTEDLKSSIDLQARIAAENGMALNELMRLQAIQVQQKAAEDNERLMGYRRTSIANRFDASETAKAFTLEEE